MRILWITLLEACVLFAINGCSEEPRPAAEEPTTAAETVDLSDIAIQAIAEKQKVCAVTGEPLGSMGTPVPVRVMDSLRSPHTVLLCCESRGEELLSDPETYHAKLSSEKPIAKSP